MSLYKHIRHSTQKALKAHDSDKVRTLRTLLAKLKEEIIQKGDDLTEQEEIKVLRSAAKQRFDAIDLYKKGERFDLVENESKELLIINTYLPKQLAQDELVTLVESVIKETGVTAVKDIGKVMPVIMKKVAGRADGKIIQQIVRDKLGE